MISSSSCLASSQPATSAKVTLGVSPVSSLAFDFPNAKARLPPCCIWRNMKIIRPAMSSSGHRFIRNRPMDCLGSLAFTSTPLARSEVTQASFDSNGSSVVNLSAVRRPAGMAWRKSPRTCWRSVTSTAAMLLSESCCENWV